VYYINENTGLIQWVRPGSEDERIAKEYEARLALSRPLRSMQSVLNLQKFMGRWYVLATIPTKYEVGISNCVEDYRWDDRKKVVQVSYNYNAAKTRAPAVMYQRGRIVNAPLNTQWFISPLVMGVYINANFAYLVLDVDPEYTFTIIGVPNRKYIWVMTRLKPQRKQADRTINYLQALDRLRAAGSIPPLQDVSKAPAPVEDAANGHLDPNTEEIMLRDAVNKAATWGYDTEALLNVEWTA
jgi:apolipoprotein D and lipocalin family protein